MQAGILKLLRKSGGKYVSGEEIADRLGVSRTAVWKHIGELRNLGYRITSQPRSGYILEEAPDLLLPEEVQNGLKTSFIGQNIIHFDSIGSTNAEAKRLAGEGATEGTVVVAEEQGKGRGRLDRSFFSPQGGIWFSTILRPAFLPQEAPKCTLMAAVSVAKAMDAFGFRVGIKWPNDILHEGKKLTGILTEMHAEMDRVNYIVIGIGINVNIPQSLFPPELQETATSLQIIKGTGIPRLKIFQSVLENMEDLYTTATSRGFSPIMDEWRKCSSTLGHEVQVIGVGQDDRFTGKAVDIDDDGALIIDTEKGRRRVLAGDVSIRSSK
ncbi:MAG TPA: biotin--[acetyl-CoA-carboxylase] ligase [Selenomonas sp.]|nr:biotin--[acetyl-CoA-carboxylase] ligase [Selenomonas sp.]